MKIPKVEMVAVASLVPWAKNPRKGHAVDAIVRSIERMGYLAPIVAQKGTCRVLAGHGRLEALKKMGATEIPVVMADLTDEEASAYTIADNRLTERAEWDVEEPHQEESAEPIEARGDAVKVRRRQTKKAGKDRWYVYCRGPIHETSRHHTCPECRGTGFIRLK